MPFRVRARAVRRAVIDSIGLLRSSSNLARTAASEKDRYRYQTLTASQPMEFIWIEESSKLR